MARRPWGGWELSPAEERAAAVARGLPPVPQWRQQLEDLSFEHSTDTDILKVGNNLYTTCFNNIWQSRLSKVSPKNRSRPNSDLGKQASLPNLKHAGKQATSVPTAKLTDSAKQLSSSEPNILAGKWLYAPLQESHLKKWQLDASTHTLAASRIGFGYGVHGFAKSWPSAAAKPRSEHLDNHDGPVKQLLAPKSRNSKTSHRAPKSLNQRVTIEGADYEAVPGGMSGMPSEATSKAASPSRGSARRQVNGELVKVVMTSSPSRMSSKSSQHRIGSKSSSNLRMASKESSGSKRALENTEDANVEEIAETRKSTKQSSRMAHVPGDIVKQAFDYFKSYAKYPTDAEHHDIIEQGRLSSNQFMEVLRELTGCAHVGDIPEDLAEEALVQIGKSNLDHDDDEGIGFEEFVLWFGSHAFSEGLMLSPEQRHMREVARKHGMLYVDVEEYKRKYDHFDTDGSGFICANEFEELLSKMLKLPSGQNLPKNRLKGFWREADIDGNGHIDFEEFLVFYRRYFDDDSSGGGHLNDIYHLHRPGGV